MTNRLGNNLVLAVLNGVGLMVFVVGKFKLQAFFR